MPIQSSGWTLTNIIQKVRDVTGTPSSDQLTDAQITAYINDYQVYTMPSELKEQVQNNFLEFKTQVGINEYPMPGGFFTNAPGAYADGFPLIFYEDPDIFFQDWPQQYAVNTVGVGTGVQTTFTGVVQNPPLIVESFFITDSVQVVQDIGVVSPDVYPNGTLSGPDGTGTINYLTGAFSVTFNAAPASTLTVYCKYLGYAPNRPQGVLWYENIFTFMPVPDQVYQILMQGFIQPALLVNPSDTPAQQEWGPLIAYGASLDIFSDRGDTDNYDRYYPIMKRFENVALSRTIQQYTPMQGVPRF